MNILNTLITSDARVKLIKHFILNPYQKIHLRGLQRNLKVNSRMLTLELMKLKRIGLIKEELQGNMKLYSANTNAGYFTSLVNFINDLYPQNPGWYKWERPGAPFALYNCLKGQLNSFTKFWDGLIWPKNILLFKEGHLSWNILWQDLYNLGKEIATKLSKGKNLKKYKKEIKKVNIALNKQIDIVKNTKFNKLSNEKFINIVKKFHDVYTDWWSVTIAVEPISTYLNSVLNAKLSRIPINDKTIIISSDFKSFNQEFEDDYETLVNFARSISFNWTNRQLKKNINNFIDKYFWINMNYLNNIPLSFNQVVEGITKRSKKERKKAKKINLTVQKKELFEKYKIETETKKLVELGDFFIMFTDQRKIFTMKVPFYQDVILKELERRSKIKFKLLEHMIPDELSEISKIINIDLKTRCSNFVIVTADNKIIEKVTGEEAKKYSINFLQDNTNKSYLIIKGDVASPGSTVGEIKVLTDPVKEGFKVKHGDIIVASMTSPDYVSLFRKVVGIITDEGGITCHAAVISREIGLPCIIGTQNATKKLKDGDLVEMDANKGEIKLIYRAE